MRHVLPPGRGRGSSVGSLVCYLTGLSHVDPVANNLSLGRFLNRELASVPDIDLDFPRDIREKLIVRVTERYGREHASLVASFATYRSRGAIRDVGKALGLPYADLERLAKLSDGWNAQRVADEIAALPDAAREARVAALARVRRALHRDRRPAAPHLPAPRRDGHLHAPARRARARPAGGDGGTADVPVGQGLVRRRRLPEDRPARARDAVGGRGVRRPDREAPRRADRPLARRRSTTRTSSRRSSAPTPSAASRSRAARRCRRSSARGRRTSTTSRCRSRSCGPGRSRAAPSIRTSSGGRSCARTRRSSRRPIIRCSQEPLRETLGVDRLPGSGARRRDPSRRLHRRRGGGTAPRDEPQALARGARGVSRALRRRRAREGRRRAAWRTELYDKLVAFSGLRLPEVALRGVRAARVPVGVAAAPLQRGVPRGAAERAADGLLSAGDARARRAAARRRDAPARRQPQRRQLRDRGRRRSRRAEVRARRGGGRRDASSSSAPQRPYGSIRELAQRTGLVSEDELSALVESRRLRLLRTEAARAAVAARPRAAAGRPCRARAARRSSSRSRSTRPSATPDLPEPTVWERMLTDYRTTSLSVGVHPLELLRPHLPRGDAVERGAARRSRTGRTSSSPASSSRGSGRRRRTASVFMLLEDEEQQINLVIAAAGVRALPRGRARRAAAPRARPLRALGPKPQHPRPRARLPRPARAASSPTGRTSTARSRARTTSGTASATIEVDSRAHALSEGRTCGGPSCVLGRLVCMAPKRVSISTPTGSEES